MASSPVFLWLQSPGEYLANCQLRGRREGGGREGRGREGGREGRRKLSEYSGTSE